MEDSNDKSGVNMPYQPFVGDVSKDDISVDPILMGRIKSRNSKINPLSNKDTYKNIGQRERVDANISEGEKTGFIFQDAIKQWNEGGVDLTGFSPLETNLYIDENKSPIFNTLFGDYHSKYDTYNPNIDNDSVHAKRQGTLGRLASVIPRFLYGATASAIGVFNSDLQMANSLINGDPSKLWDNSYLDKSIAGEELMRELYPIYHDNTVKEKDGFLGAIYNYTLGENRGEKWANIAIDGAMTIGTLGGVVLENAIMDPILTATTGGGGAVNLARGGKRVWDSIAHLFKGARAAEDVYKNIRTARKLQKTLKGAGKVSKYSHNLATATIYEAGVEANMASKEFINKETEAYKATYGVEEIPNNVLEEIKKQADDVGNQTMAINSAVLSVSNAIQFGKILKGGKFFNQTGNSLMDDVVKVGGVAATKKEAAKSAGKLLQYNLKRGGGLLFNATTEGGEEVLQGLASGSAQRYNSIYTNEITDSYIEAISDTLRANIDSNQIYEELLSGMIIGGMSKVVGKVGNKYVTKEDKKREELIDEYNKTFSDNVKSASFSIGVENKDTIVSNKNLQNSVKDGAIQINTGAGQIQSISDNDKKKYHDYRGEGLASMLHTNTVNGKDELGKEMFNTYLDEYNDDNYAREIMLQPNATIEEIKIDKNSRKQKFALKQDSYTKTYNDISLQYKNPYDSTNDPIRNLAFEEAKKDATFYSYEADESLRRGKILSGELLEEINAFNNKTQDGLRDVSSKDISVLFSGYILNEKIEDLKKELELSEISEDGARNKSVKKISTRNTKEIKKGVVSVEQYKGIYGRVRGGGNIFPNRFAIQ